MTLLSSHFQEHHHKLQPSKIIIKSQRFSVKKEFNVEPEHRKIFIEDYFGKSGRRPVPLRGIGCGDQKNNEGK